MDPIISELMAAQSKIVKYVPRRCKRYLYKQIDWEQRMLAVTGARGTGKTTLVLQHFLDKYKDARKCLYISADNPLVLKKGLYGIIDEYFKFFGECVIVDEVHKQRDWSIDIKALYDIFPNKKFIILGSSKVEILHQKSDLSRRLMIYNLKPLSLREYIEMKYETELDTYLIEDILLDQIKISSKILGKIDRMIGIFHEFLSYGMYPFILECNVEQYYVKMNNIIDKIIYEDVPTIKDIKSSSSLNLKKLIAFISMSKIPTLNISLLCTEIGISKETLYVFLDLLERADLLNIIKPKKSTVRTIKNSKILFYSSNMYYTIANELWQHDVLKGNIRESFLVSQIKGLYPIFSSEVVDFSIQSRSLGFLEFEVGGKSKQKKQIQNLENGFILRDDTEIGSGNIIPLYLFGFLY